jgi:hypothetical protein
MNNKNKSAVNKFKLFKKAYKDEFEPANKRYEEALKEFEESMKNFAIKNITGKTGFKKAYKNTFDEIRKVYQHERGKDMIDNKMALEYLIQDHLFWLEEEQDEEEFIAI